MLKLQNVGKSYGQQILFDGVSLQMNPGERLGLIGRNGHGKSTLFRMILGEEHEDEGTISMPKNYRVGHLQQHIHFTEYTVVDEVCLGLPEGEEDDRYKAERILFGLGFSEEDLWKNPNEFSGGYQVRINLARVLVSKPNLLLLDEPTNYLDVVSIRWITRFLRQWDGEMILISHDREFMDSVTTHTALIHRAKVRKVEGNTAKIYELVQQDEVIYEKTRQNMAKEREKAEAFIDRFRAQASKASIVQSRVKQLARLPELEELSTISELDFKFRYAPFEAKTILDAKDLSFAYDGSGMLFENLDLNIGSKDRIAVIGKNGRGKSTLLNVLAGNLNPVTGTVKAHPNASLGVFGQTNILRLDPKLTIEQEVNSADVNLSRTTVRALCGLMMFSGDFAEKKIAALSGGEKSRVQLAKILACPANLLLLDEPTNHLDMHSIEALTEAVDKFEGAVVIVTHSEEMLRRLATKLVVFHNGGVEVFNGNYDDFLEKIGWEDEQGGKKKREAKNKNDRQKRAELVGERSKILTPLKKRIEELELEITKYEQIAETANREILKASESGDAKKIAEVSKQLTDAQNKIEALFSELASVSAEFESQSQNFEA